MLFPIYGKEAEYIECICVELWRVAFLGTIASWNNRHPDHPKGFSVPGRTSRLEAHELASQAPFIELCAWEYPDGAAPAFVLPVVSVVMNGVLYHPATYENFDVVAELPRCDVDHQLQLEWRKHYEEDLTNDIAGRIDGDPGIVGYGGAFNPHAYRYMQWRKADDAGIRKEELSYQWG